MTATTRRVTFIGLDPVPVDLLLPAEVSEDGHLYGCWDTR
jgi:hypothetical protein